MLYKHTKKSSVHETLNRLPESMHEMFFFLFLSQFSDYCQGSNAEKVPISLCILADITSSQKYVTLLDKFKIILAKSILYDYTCLKNMY